MISFIIIGRNEGWKLTKCLQSVFDTIEHNALKEYEVIYVDSKSTDDSIKRATSFDKIKIIQLTGDFNAAIARNIGAKESKGNVLFFIDGDMEIQSEFLQLVYSEEAGLFHDFVSGQFMDYNYDINKNLINKKLYHKISEGGNKEFVVGGLFIIKKYFWKLVGGMKNHLRISQDIDFGLRLAQKGVFLIRKNELLARHHTISYSDDNRIWADIFNGNQMYRSLLLRENIFNIFQWKLFLRENYTFLTMVTLIFISFIIKSVLVLFPYLVLVIVRAFKRRSKSLKNLLNISFYFIVRDSSVALSLMLFWPKKNKYINYINIK